MIRETQPLEFRQYRFSTAQLNRGLRPKLHRDAANLGPSHNRLRAVCGGHAMADDGSQPYELRPPRRPLPAVDLVRNGWHCVARGASVLWPEVQPGALPSRSGIAPAARRGFGQGGRTWTGHVGGCASSLSAPQAARSRDRSEDWPFRAALTEVAEATLELASTTYDSLRRHLQGEQSPRTISSAAVAKGFAFCCRPDRSKAEAKSASTAATCPICRSPCSGSADGLLASSRSIVTASSTLFWAARTLARNSIVRN